MPFLEEAINLNKLPNHKTGQSFKAFKVADRTETQKISYSFLSSLPYNQESLFFKRVCKQYFFAMSFY